MSEGFCGGHQPFGRRHSPMDFFGLGPLQHLFAGADIDEGQEDVTLKLPLPGLTKEDFDLIVGPDMLVVTFKEKQVGEEKEDEREFGSMWFYAKRALGSTRRVSLPTEVDPETAKAKLENGVLRVTVRKKNPGRRVDVE